MTSTTLTSYELEILIRAACKLRESAVNDKNARALQSKNAKQRAEIARLTAKVKSLELLAHSRGALILEIQKRSLERQVEGHS